MFHSQLYQEDLLLSNFAEMECEDKIHEVEYGLYPPAMIFNVGYELPPSKESRIKFLKASLCGVKNEINFSFPVLENSKMCSCSGKQRAIYDQSEKSKLGSNISKSMHAHVHLQTHTFSQSVANRYTIPTSTYRKY